MVTQQVPQTQPPTGPEGSVSPPPGAAPAAQPRTLTADAQQATPEEQELYEQFVSKAFMLVYDEKFFPTVVEMLRGGDDPIEGLAVAASTVIARVLTAAKDAQADLPGDVAFHAGKEVFEDLAELSRQAGIHDFSADPDAFEGAYFRTLDRLRQTLEGTGDINKEAAEADLAMLQQMDESGELEGLFRDLASRDDAALGNGGGAPAPDTSGQAPSPVPPSGGLMPQGAQ